MSKRAVNADTLRSAAAKAADADLVDPANTTLGHRQVQRWNLLTRWSSR